MKSFRKGWLAALVAAAGCISPNSDVLDGTEPCDPEGEVDPAVRQFLEASQEFGAAADGLQADVLQACANVALDLGAEDTWSQETDRDLAVSNAAGTGACDVAARLVEAALLEAGQANAEIAL